MTDDDKKSYPDLYNFIRFHMAPLERTKPKVFEAFKKWTGVTDTWFWSGIRHPLNYVSLPRVCVDSESCRLTGESTPVEGGVAYERKILRYGFTVPARDIDEIHIADDLALGAGSGQFEILLEATLLHELIHWCRKVNGMDVFDEDPPYSFEREAYGKVQVRTWNNCQPDVIRRHVLM